MNLERLKQLLASGAITQEEFDQMAVGFQEETREEEGDTGEEESDTAEEAESKMQHIQMQDFNIFHQEKN